MSALQGVFVSLLRVIVLLKKQRLRANSRLIVEGWPQAFLQFRFACIILHLRRNTVKLYCGELCIGSHKYLLRKGRGDE